jgi:hypothetical protein
MAIELTERAVSELRRIVQDQSLPYRQKDRIHAKIFSKTC